MGQESKLLTASNCKLGRRQGLFRAALLSGLTMLGPTALLYSQQIHDTKPQSALASPALRNTLQRDFNAKISEYLKLRKQATSGNTQLKTTNKPQDISRNQQDLSDSIRSQRANAKQGDVFIPGIADFFRAAIKERFQTAQGSKIKASLKHAEPVDGLSLQINGPYPDKVPLQSTPPSLLLNLPRLPKGLEYRIVGRDLVLRDSEANLIVDVIPDALPAS